ncbi:MAG: hypothetical protein M0Z28_04275 [Rhodospirillales bacterium]|nr:hypothetical protein [Rhodospirillales bacterium]
MNRSCGDPKASLTAGERVQFYRTEAAIGVATSEFGTARTVTAGSVEVVKDDAFSSSAVTNL